MGNDILVVIMGSLASLCFIGSAVASIRHVFR